MDQKHAPQERPASSLPRHRRCQNQCRGQGGRYPAQGSRVQIDYFAQTLAAAISQIAVAQSHLQVEAREAMLHLVRLEEHYPLLIRAAENGVSQRLEILP